MKGEELTPREAFKILEYSARRFENGELKFGDKKYKGHIAVISEAIPDLAGHLVSLLEGIKDEGTRLALGTKDDRTAAGAAYGTELSATLVALGGAVVYLLCHEDGE